jgi:hypothetical protein
VQNLDCNSYRRRREPFPQRRRRKETNAGGQIRDTGRNGHDAQQRVDDPEKRTVSCPQRCERHGLRVQHRCPLQNALS